MLLEYSWLLICAVFAVFTNKIWLKAKTETLILLTYNT